MSLFRIMPLLLQLYIHDTGKFFFIINIRLYWTYIASVCNNNKNQAISIDSTVACPRLTLHYFKKNSPGHEYYSLRFLKFNACYFLWLGTFRHQTDIDITCEQNKFCVIPYIFNINYNF